MQTINEQLANHIEQARTRLQQAEATYGKATSFHSRISQRVADLQQERQLIIQARAAGMQDEGQETRLTVIAADLEGLEPLLRQAEAEATRLDPHPARQNVVMAEEQWNRHQLEVQFHTMAQRTKEIESTLVAAVAELDSLGKRLGAGHQHLSQNWRPSHDLGRLIHHGALPKVAQ